MAPRVRTILVAFTLAVLAGHAPRFAAPGLFEGEALAAEERLENMSLEQLLAVPVEVAAPSRPTPARETPGLVTVITREEILESGARDLQDVLALVPGFGFGVDVQGCVGLGFRGVWGHEGKILLMLDGQELNELDYSTNQLGNRWPVDQVQKVEIIRGPGSVQYGGFAELAVINVVTRTADDWRGGAVTLTEGHLQHTLARRTLGVAAAAPVQGVEGLDVSLGAFLGEGNRSDGTYVDAGGAAWPMAGASSLDPRYLNLSIRYKGLATRFILDDYRVDFRDGFGPVTAAPVRMSFPSYYAEARYAWQVSDTLVLTPRFRFKHQLPWWVTDRTSEYYADRYVDRYVGSLSASWNPLPSLSLLAGLEGTVDRAALNDPSTVNLGLHQPYSNDGTSVAYEGLAVLGQVAWANPVADVTLGARFEVPTEHPSSFVPRVALTRALGWFHAKLMFAQAFREPGIMNLAINRDLDPERTTVAELELGARLGSHVMLTAAAFDLTLDDAIIFTSVKDNGQIVETYRNVSRTGSRGMEADLRLQLPRWRAALGYAYYNSSGKNRVDSYAVPGRDDLLLGFPAHKISLSGALRLNDRLSLAPTLLFTSASFGVSHDPLTDQARAERLGPRLVVNLYLNCHDLLTPGLDLGLGVYNLLNADVPYLQPYDGGHAPLPGPSREFLARLTYAWGW